MKKNVNLKEKSQWVWNRTLQVHQSAGETRIASSLSCIEIFVALYYGGVLKHYPDDPYHEKRDRCIISKGHGSICMYPILADRGFFPEDELQRVCKSGGFLGGIPDPIIPGYETLNGSLGHGLGVGTGMALGLRRRNAKQHVFVIVGDGELHEGANWEEIMFAAHHKLSNLIVIIDDNKTSMLDHTANIIDQRPFENRFQSFGWETATCDGHNADNVANMLIDLKQSEDSRPKVLVASTVKGRGVPGLENEPLAHILNPKPEVLDALIGDKE